MKAVKLIQKISLFLSIWLISAAAISAQEPTPNQRPTIARTETRTDTGKKEKKNKKDKEMQSAPQPTPEAAKPDEAAPEFEAAVLLY